MATSSANIMICRRGDLKAPIGTAIGVLRVEDPKPELSTKLLLKNLQTAAQQRLSDDEEAPGLKVIEKALTICKGENFWGATWRAWYMNNK